MKLKDVDQKFVTALKEKSIDATMGGDPEFFVANRRGKILGSDSFFPGKENPLTFDGMPAFDGKSRTLKLFFDGIQAEMNIGAQHCREYSTTNVYRCFKKAIGIIEKKNLFHQIILKPSVKVARSVIMNADPEARRFGCEPDFNAYTLTTNTGEIDATNHLYRYAGGHIHLGVSSQYIKKNSGEGKIAKTEEGHLRIIRLLDLILGIPCVLLDDSEEAKRRRAQYGKAGCFRPTPYGIEYRTPSCWWIKSPTTVSLALGLARLAWTVAGHSQDDNMFKLIGCEPEDIRGIIDESDKKEAVKVWKKMGPHIAVIGGSYNPLNIRSIRSKGIQFTERGWVGRNGELPIIEGNPVFSLAVFEYMIKNGLNSLISDNVKEEWKIDKKFEGYRRGFSNGMYGRLCRNKDFLGFQMSFLKQII